MKNYIPVTPATLVLVNITTGIKCRSDLGVFCILQNPLVVQKFINRI